MLYRPLFLILECPNIKLKKPSFVTWPSPMVVFMFFLLTYFLITGGVVYDMIVGPPSMGSETDARGNQRPYILEGLAASFMFTLGSIGFIVMDKMNEARVTKLNRVLLMALGIGCILISFITLRIFIKTKLPSYMR
ncbi:Oligosaccharyltransferase complex non-catalytic subunit [Paragonimus heterotremus]|uniref:Oligosaccharyltransferase complex subunit n=1 Tax=Paragonimus heterotremus TaxID=100268 RepID=A0A8J4T5M5_9TREM|nr:Oligosaccharyltransferase complex non-catalytic subunit [Paragonimus heterotremus]